jgi:hypothetical protein
MVLQNPECKMLNLAEQNQIKSAVEKGEKPMLICANCGFVETSIKTATKNSEDYLHDIPFEGLERRLPNGSI